MKNLLLIIFTCLTLVVKGQVTSTGPGTNWNDPTTWSTMAVPGVNADVIIGTPVTITANATCGSVTVNMGQTLTINSTFRLDYKTTLTVNGTLAGAGTLRTIGTVPQSIGGIISTVILSVNNGTGGSTNITSNCTFGSVTVVAAKTLTIDAGSTLTSSGTTTNNGTATINGTLSGTGNITNNGASSVMSIAVAGIVNASDTFINDGSLTNDGTLNATGAVTLSAGSSTSGAGIYNLLSNLTNNATTATLATVNLNNSSSGVQTLSGASGSTTNITNLNYPSSSNSTIRINGGTTASPTTPTFNISNATFSGSGSVTSAQQGTPTVNFTNLAMNLDGNTFTFNSGGTYGVITSLTVDNSVGNKTITNNGTISVTTVTLSNSTTLTFNGTAGTFNIATLSSTATGSTRFNGTGITTITDATFSGTSSVILANANSPTINITNLTNSLNGNDLTFNAIGTYGPLTSLTMNTGVNLDRTVLNEDLTVTNLTLTRGRIEPATTISLIVTGSITGGSNASYVNTGAAGSALRRNGISGTSVFPVGNSRYNPVSIIPSASTDLAVRALTATTHTPTVPDETRTALVQYDIKNLGASAVTADITLNWQAGDQGVNYVASTPKNMYQVLAGNWSLITGSTAGNTSASTSGLSLAAGATNTLSAFAQAALPVELVNFTATIENDNTLLTWRTLSERNNLGFEIEKSLNAKDFSKIGFKDGAGTSDLTREYNFVDYELTKVSYYRLKQIDLDGRYEYSKVVVVIPEGMSDEMKVSPNPASEKLKIVIKGTIQQVNLLNINGQIVLSDRKKILDIASLPDGMYILQVVTDIGVKTKKIVKQ